MNYHPNITISIIGLGKLGGPMLGVFAEKGFQVYGVDVNHKIVDSIKQGISPISEPGLQELINNNLDRINVTTDINEAVSKSNVTFIIVPTPSDKNSFFSNEFLTLAIQSIGSALKQKPDYHNVVITSTVMPGTTGGVIKKILENSSGRTIGANLGLCYNPEFIALGSVIQDMLSPDMILIGESDSKAGDILEEIYRQSTISNPSYYRMNWINAEICKISVNTYVTTKISYANMIAELCDYLPDADADIVTDALGADSRIGKKYLKGAVAYGGPCFPRDNTAFAALGRQLGIRTDLADATDLINEHQTVRLVRAVQAVMPNNAKIVILGLSYKPNTPVIERSQGYSLALSLSSLGYHVTVTDPEALSSLEEILPEGISAAQSIDLVDFSSAAVIIVTPWQQYREPKFQEKIADMGPKALIDPWHIFDEKLLKSDTAFIRLGAGNLKFFTNNASNRLSGKRV